MNFVTNTSNQVKNNVLNLQERYELIANNIYANTSIRFFLIENYASPIDYKMFERYDLINSIFEGIRNNYKEILSIYIYKENPKLLVDGINIKDINEYKNEELIKKAREQAGSNVWGLQQSDREDGSYDIILLKHINIEKPSGYLAITISEESFLDLYENEIGDNNLLYIVDDNYKVISSNHREKTGEPLPQMIVDTLGESDFPKKIKIEKNSYYINHEIIKDNWTLVMLYSSTQIEIENRKIEYFIITLTSIFIVAAVLISLYFARRFSLKVNQLVFKIRKLESGNLNIIPSISGEDEFVLLDETLCSMANRIELLTKDILIAIKQKEESEIKFLQMQMNPHFLYNLLSSIRWIAFKNKQNKIIFILENLISFYKIALSKGNEIIPIEDEISLINSYVALQNVCYNNSIKLNVYLEEGLEELQVCKMTLQPFVENSIIHGRQQEAILNIDITIEKINDMIVLTIADDGKGFDAETLEYFENLYENYEKKATENYGIMNTYSRLNLLYKDRVKLFASNNKKGSTVEIVITL